jgi:hypothetical protein
MACDELVRRLGALANADPPIDLRSHPETRRLLDEPSPTGRDAYKRREDLLDAAICAWTADYWSRHGLVGCQVLGLDADARGERRRRSSRQPAPSSADLPKRLVEPDPRDAT